MASGELSSKNCIVDDGIDYSAKGKDEVLKGLLIPRESLARRNVYLKLRRRGSFDFPILGVAATMETDEGANAVMQGLC